MHLLNRAVQQFDVDSPAAALRCFTEADVAVVASYLSTARKWGIDMMTALSDLFTTRAWLLPALEPCR